MKWLSNFLQPRQIELLVGFLGTALLAAGIFLYGWQEPQRIQAAQNDQLQAGLDEAMSLYAENCVVCHGLSGEGLGATPALNASAVQSMEADALAKIIERGLYNTAMPAWSITDGGPLSDYQIDELATLIQWGDWQAAQDRVVNLGLAPSVPFTTQPDPAILAALVDLPGGDLLAQGVNLYAEECVACHGADGLGSSLAPALNDPVVRAKSTDELQRTLLNGVAGTIMAGWQNNLTELQVTALITLITRWDSVPAGAIPAPQASIPVTAESLLLGGDLYAQNCSFCHAPEGQGTPRAPALNVKSFLTDTTDSAIQQIVSKGVPGTAMPAWGERLTEAEIQAVVGFIRSWEPNAPEVATPARGGGQPWWQSGGGVTPGGKSGGPPWLRSGSTDTSASAGMSSGGGISLASSSTSAHAGGGTTALGGGASGSGLAHSQQTTELTAWQKLDWRVILLLSGVGVAAFGLLAAGLAGIRRLEAV